MCCICTKRGYIGRHSWPTGAAPAMPAVRVVGVLYTGLKTRQSLARQNDDYINNHVPGATFSRIVIIEIGSHCVRCTRGDFNYTQVLEAQEVRN